jgi:hypothetical protein
MVPTGTDRQVLASMQFNRGRFDTAVNMNCRKYQRLEDIGWVKGISTNASNVEYHLTAAGLAQIALNRSADMVRNDVPDPRRMGFKRLSIQARGVRLTLS